MSIHEVSIAQFTAYFNATKTRTAAERSKSGADVYVKQGNHWRLTRVKGTSWRACGFPQQPTHPVTCVTWTDAVRACGWFTRKTGMTVRLPTEAEWEYACRAGGQMPFAFGHEEKTLAKYGNFADKRSPVSPRFGGANDNSEWTSATGRYVPNAWGLYDMHGNVAEWCLEGGGKYLSMGPVKDPRSHAGSYRAVRGGAWDSLPKGCRSAFRNRATTSCRGSTLGFRVVAEIK